MNVPRLVVLFVALLSGGGAAYLSFVYMRRDAPAAAVQQVQVLLIARDVNAGSPLGNADLRWAAWPAQAVTPGMITQSAEPRGPQAFLGRIATERLFTGEPLRRDKLLETANGGLLANMIPSGMRGYAIAIDEKLSAGGFVLPNDRVDVLILQDTGDAASPSRTVLQNVRVLAVGHRIDPAGDKIALGRHATVAVTPAEVEMLAGLERYGRLMLSLRNATDSAVVQFDRPARPDVIVIGR